MYNLDLKSLQGELWGWTCFFIGVAAVGIGSSYYHLKPNDARLVWDRLPVSIVVRALNGDLVFSSLVMVPYICACGGGNCR